MKIASFCIKHKVTTILAFVIIAVFGVVFYSNLKLALMPNMEFPAAYVMCTYAGAGPEDVEELVTRPLESCVSTLSGVDTISSTSSENVSMVMITYEDGTDVDDAAIKLREKFDALSLPDGCSDPVIYNFNVNDMLVMNTKESPDYPFYGTVYGTGNATIAGNAQDGVNIDVAMTTNRNTTFTYIKDNVSTAVSNQFIKFVDKTPRRAVQDSVRLSDYEIAQKEIEEEKESDTDIRLNLLVDATPDATMKIIMDPIAGDYISGRGTGNIRTEFFNKGDVKMFGSYRINQGVYKFSLQEVIRKDFIIRDGSTITFNGSPLDATLDIKAGYTVNSASLNDLMPNEATSGYISQTNVKVNCMMDLTGQLTSPDVKFDIELPNERDEVQAIVRNYIPTDEQMNMQILYLLAIGKFYTPENLGATQNSNMMSSVVSSTLSGQLNNALSNILDVNNWNFGTNFSTGERGWTDMEFETMLSGQLLNNRLLINGNFGYRDNPMANTNFVGDFEAEWLVNRSGDIRLKAYNETNDRYYTRTNLTTQGIGIIFKKDFNKWSELLFWNRWKLNRLRKEQEIKQDTLSSDKINTEQQMPEAQSKRKREQK